MLKRWYFQEKRVMSSLYVLRKHMMFFQILESEYVVHLVNYVLVYV